jgi:bifunctional non-homologous end joining protein LigD
MAPAGDRVVALSQAFDDGEALMTAALELGLEGVTAKRVDAPYRPGKRSR